MPKEARLTSSKAHLHFRVDGDAMVFESDIQALTEVIERL
jgi:hypothetical protein